LEFVVRGVEKFNEPGVFVSFEETADELARDVASIGIDLARAIKSKKLFVDYIEVDPRHAQSAGEYDLEGLFIRLRHAIDSVKAKRLVIDSIEALFSGFGDSHILRAEIGRLFRWLKTTGMTAIITAEKGEGSITRHGLEEYLADCVVFLDHRVTDEHSVRRLRVIKYRGALRLRLRQEEWRKVYEAEIAAGRAAMSAEPEELEGACHSEPPDERANRVAELEHRKRI
jgi:circadian clock protein KaiC